MAGRGVGPGPIPWQAEQAAFWSSVLDQLIADLRQLLDPQRADFVSTRDALNAGVKVAARVLQCPFAFGAVLHGNYPNAHYEITGAAALSQWGRIPAWVRSEPRPNLDFDGLLKLVVDDGEPHTLERDESDPLKKSGIECAVAVSLDLRGLESPVLAVCNRPKRYAGSRYPYPPDRDGRKQTFGTNDKQLLWCIARIVERA